MERGWTSFDLSGQHELTYASAHKSAKVKQTSMVEILDSIFQNKVSCHLFKRLLFALNLISPIRLRLTSQMMLSILEWAV